MSYQEQSDLYRTPDSRNRIEMCVREQGAIFVADGRPDIAALGVGVVSGVYRDIDAVIAAAFTGPNSGTIAGDDAALLAAVQEAWPRVAAALYPPDTPPT